MKKSPLSFGTWDDRAIQVVECRAREATHVHCDLCGIVGHDCHPYFKLGSQGWMHQQGHGFEHKIRYAKIEFIDKDRP